MDPEEIITASGSSSISEEVPEDAENHKSDKRTADSFINSTMVSVNHRPLERKPSLLLKRSISNLSEEAAEGGVESIEPLSGPSSVSMNDSSEEAKIWLDSIGLLSNNSLNITDNLNEQNEFGQKRADSSLNKISKRRFSGNLTGENWKQDLEKITDELIDLVSENDRLEKTVNLLNLEKEEFEKTVASLWKKASEERNQTNNLANDFDNEIENLSKQISELKLHIQELQDQLKKYSALTKEKEEILEENEQLNNILIKKQEELTGKKQELEKEIAERDKVARKATKIEEDHKNLKSQYGCLKVQLEKLREKYKEVSISFSQETENKRILQKSMDDLGEKYNALQEKYEKLINDQEDEQANLNHRLKKSEKQRQEAERIKSVLEENIFGLKKEIEELKKQDQVAKQALAENISLLQEKSAEIAALKREKEIENEDRANAKTLLKTLEERQRKLENELVITKNEGSKAKASVKFLESELSKVRTELENAKKQNAELSMNPKKERIKEAFKKEITRVTKQKVQATEMVSKLLRENEELKQENTVLENILQKERERARQNKNIVDQQRALAERIDATKKQQRTTQVKTAATVALPPVPKLNNMTAAENAVPRDAYTTAAEIRTSPTRAFSKEAFERIIKEVIVPFIEGETQQRIQEVKIGSNDQALVASFPNTPFGDISCKPGSSPNTIRYEISKRDGANGGMSLEQQFRVLAMLHLKMFPGQFPSSDAIKIEPNTIEAKMAFSAALEKELSLQNLRNPNGLFNSRAQRVNCSQNLDPRQPRLNMDRPLITL